MADDHADRLGFARRRIAEHIAERLGFGPIRTMPPGLLRRLDQEVDDAVVAWRQARDRDPGLVPRTPLQQLLAAHQAIGRGPRP